MRTSVPLTEAARRLDELEREIARDEGALALIEEDIERLSAALAQQDVDLSEIGEVLGIFQELEDSWHQSFEERISTLITRGLQLVFEEDFEFRIVSRMQGDLSALDFKLVQRYGETELVTDVMGAKGGGVVAVVGFLLRVLILLAHKPPLRPFIALDETFAHLSREYVPNMAHLLRQLANETGIQFLLVTHEPAFTQAADVVYDVTQKDGHSVFVKR